MMKIGLYFGSFNPIHLGHLIVANHMAEFSDLDEIWLVISPCNPWKNTEDLLDIFHRIKMTKLALEGYKKLKICEIELQLPRPSYTINTLNALRKKYPNHNFNLIMGDDLLSGFEKWEGYQEIIKNYLIYVYPRKENIFDQKYFLEKNFYLLQAPKIEISSTFIREFIKNKKNVKPFLDQKVYEYLKENFLYK